MKVTSMKCKYTSLVHTHVCHAHRHTQRRKESEALLSKSRECAVLGGAKQIQSRADTILRDTLETGWEEWSLGVSTVSLRSRRQAPKPDVWGLPSYVPGGKRAFLWHVLSCIFPHSSSLFCLEGGIRLHRRELQQSFGFL